MHSLLEIIKRSTEFLAGKGVESPRLSAEILIGHALGRKRMQLYLEFERPVTETELGLIRPLIKRRSLHEPLQYITGKAEFCGNVLKADRRALIPRQETEMLVEQVLAWCFANPPVERICDLGTGSGAIALALAQAMPNVGLVAVDVDSEAMALACENISSAGLQERVSVLPSNWYDALQGQSYDVIVSNPPYLSEEEMAQTAEEVQGFEPKIALAADDKGFGALEKIIAGAPRHLRPGGLLALETGITQHSRLLATLRTAGFNASYSKSDLTGRDRFILAVL
jgi:release factor glutamine methyltransferase